MKTNNSTALTQVATLLKKIEWMSQDEAAELFPLADSVLDFFVIVAYQAGTGKVTNQEFLEAREKISKSLNTPYPTENNKTIYSSCCG